MRVQSVAAMFVAAALWSAMPAAAQVTDPNPGAMTLTGGFDVLNAYTFRGIPQEEGDFGSIMWPSADLGIALMSGDGVVKSAGVNIGTWNSLQTGAFGLDGPSEKLWYESDFYATFGLGLGGGTSIGVTYTAYTSPNGMFATVQEMSVKFGIDDSGYLGGAAVKPYVLVAREVGGEGQADGGLEQGTYLELGASPSHSFSWLGVAVPLKFGFSLGDYYEGPEGDETFGYFSVAGIATVPLSSAPTRFGTWNVRGGVEYQRHVALTTQRYGENQWIGSIGLGFSY